VSFPPPADSHCIVECHIGRAAGYGAHRCPRRRTPARNEFEPPPLHPLALGGFVPALGVVSTETVASRRIAG